MEQRHKNEGPGIFAILIGIAAVAFCCFSPFILAAIGAAGLAAFFRQYLAVLMVLAGAIVVVGVLSYRRVPKEGLLMRDRQCEQLGNIASCVAVFLNCQSTFPTNQHL